MQVASLNSFSWKLIGFFAVNMVLTSFAYVLIFVVEKIFGFTSVVTLVELSDINNPVLRELSEECPGTFQHSLAVSNLASDAARRVDANVQLVRAGALYHDIGKIKNPAFFTENQHGVNPHDALDPIQSARIIISHVTDGLRRAEKAKLPTVIRDIIAQHHGRSTARYFLTTYQNAHPGEDVDPAPFTYPGPNPQSKEASLLMMADVVEAASRSLPSHDPQSIANLVNRLIDAQVAAGLHSESTLSFRDITIIKQAFIDRLRTMYHARVAYPSARS
jgi:putative nucleotidyltransferase with HDIG domain